MSYCRWSTDDYQCDLYVFDDVNGGVTVHVAKTKPVYKEPLPKPLPLLHDTVGDYLERYRKVSAMLEEADVVPIGLPHDGESYYGMSHGEAADLCESLIGLGYRAPSDLPKWLRGKDE